MLAYLQEIKQTLVPCSGISIKPQILGKFRENHQEFSLEICENSIIYEKYQRIFSHVWTKNTLLGNFAKVFTIY